MILDIILLITFVNLILLWAKISSKSMDNHDLYFKHINISLLIGDIVDGTVYLGLEDFAYSEVFFLVFSGLCLLGIQSLDQLSSFSLPITFTFLPIELHLAKGGSQLCNFLLLLFDLLLKG